MELDPLVKSSIKLCKSDSGREMGQCEALLFRSREGYVVLGNHVALLLVNLPVGCLTGLGAIAIDHPDRVQPGMCFISVRVELSTYAYILHLEHFFIPLLATSQLAHASSVHNVFFEKIDGSF